MAITQLRGSNQVLNGTVTRAKLAADFVDGATWNLSSTNTAVLTGLANPTGANDAANKGYIDGLVDSTMKSPDGYATNAAGDYPTDYKGTGAVNEGDMFYITSIANGSTVGGVTVNVGDALVALTDAPGNTDANWIVMEANRDQATETVKGVAELATQTETDAGVNDENIVTPLKLSTYVSNLNINKTAGAGLIETAGTFDVVAADTSLTVNADDMQVRIGSTNGNSLEVTATGVELLATVTGERTFDVGSGNSFDVVADVNLATLSNTPDGTSPLAIATVGYVSSVNTTADNGLTKTGNNIQLGGALTTDTHIGTTSDNHSITIDAGNGSDQGNVVLNSNGDSGISTRNGSTNTRYGVSSTTSGTSLYANDGSSPKSINVDLNNITLSAAANEPVLTNQPDGSVSLAIATTQYVDDAVSAVTDVYSEMPTVTNGSTDVTLANAPTAGTERVYLNGMRQAPGGSNDYTLSGSTVTFGGALSTGDIVIVDYKY